MNKILIRTLKLFLAVTIISATLFVNNAHVYAQNNPAKKLGRGFVNIATSPVEIPKQARVYWKKGAEKTDHILVWIFSGIVKGMVNMVGRVGSGAWDILSFPLEVPDDYEPLMKPDYVFEGGIF